MSREARIPVLFVLVPGGSTRYFSEHLGTAFLRTLLARTGIQSAQYFPERNPGILDFAEYLRKARPRVVGFTVYETNLLVSRAMIRVAREVLPESVVLVGGPNATFSPDETLEILGADGCLRGAGEGRITALVKMILGCTWSRKRLPDLIAEVKNLVWLTPDGIYRTPSSTMASFQPECFSTLDEIPSPFQAGLISSPDVGYLTARGCDQHCTYCSFASISGRRVFYHSLERVLDDLVELQRLLENVQRRSPIINMYDDAFTLDPERAGKICEGMIRRNIRLPLQCATRADRVDAKLLRLMRQAGFLKVSFGLESAVPRVLRVIGKVGPPARSDDPEYATEKEYLQIVRRAVASARKAGLLVSVSVMGGLPGETEEDFRATLEFVESLGVDHYFHNVLSLYPGTPLFRTRERFGLDAYRNPETLEWKTVLAYPAAAAVPLPNSAKRRVKWSSAWMLADALCGRPRPQEAADSTVWAVVVHDVPPGDDLMLWLRDVLAINGTIVVIGDKDSSEEAWCAKLKEFDVPTVNLYLLKPGKKGRKNVFRADGQKGALEVSFCDTWPGAKACRPFHVDKNGNLAFSVWVASSLGLSPNWDGLEGEIPTVGPGLQIADPCRWWNRFPRCEKPSVLHVFQGGDVRACWHGPTVGSLADGLEKIQGKSLSLAEVGSPHQGLVPTSRCPLVKSPEGVGRSRLEELDLASQLTWFFPENHPDNKKS